MSITTSKISSIAKANSEEMQGNIDPNVESIVHQKLQVDKFEVGDLIEEDFQRVELVSSNGIVFIYPYYSIIKETRDE